MLFANDVPELPQTPTGWTGWAIAVITGGVSVWAYWRQKGTERRSAELSLERQASEYAIATLKTLHEDCEKRNKEEASEFREIALKGENDLHQLQSQHRAEVQQLQDKILALTTDLATARALLGTKGIQP